MSKLFTEQQQKKIINTLIEFRQISQCQEIIQPQIGFFIHRSQVFSAYVNTAQKIQITAMERDHQLRLPSNLGNYSIKDIHHQSGFIEIIQNNRYQTPIYYPLFHLNKKGEQFTFKTFKPLPIAPRKLLAGLTDHFYTVYQHPDNHHYRIAGGGVFYSPKGRIIYYGSDQAQHKDQELKPYILSKKDTLHAGALYTKEDQTEQERKLPILFEGHTLKLGNHRYPIWRSPIPITRESPMKDINDFY